MEKIKKTLMQMTVGGDHVAHFINTNVICVSMEMLFVLLKKHFWHCPTKINDFGMKTFYGQKCFVIQVKTMF